MAKANQRRKKRRRKSGAGPSTTSGGGVLQGMLGGFRTAVGRGAKKKKSSGIELTITLALVAVLVGMFLYRIF